MVTCRDESEQTHFVITSILARREEGIPLRRQAVLFRAAHHSLELELELARRSIPFRKYGGLKFAETAHVKDLVSFLRLAENPRDVVAGSRVLLLLPGVGPKRAAQLMSAMNETGGDLAPWHAETPAGVAASLWREFVSLIAGLASNSHADLSSQLHAVRTFYNPLIELRFDDADARMRDLEHLEQLAGNFGSRATFLAEITLDPPTWTEDLAGPPHLDEDYLILSTMHSAKGLEWDACYVIHAADGNIPLDMACGSSEEIDEELRLFYVALTRARDHLCVCFPLRYYKLGRRTTDVHGYAQPTRFLSGGVRDRFELCDAGLAPDNPDAVAGSAVAAISTTDIRNQIKQMWS